jgi:NAD-dependent DNA ligase
VICLTGKGTKKRTEYDALIREKGWQTSETVGTRVTLVVTNNLDGDTEKLRKARALTLRIILYDEFDKMLSK